MGTTATQPCVAPRELTPADRIADAFQEVVCDEIGPRWNREYAAEQIDDAMRQIQRWLDKRGWEQR